MRAFFILLFLLPFSIGAPPVDSHTVRVIKFYADKHNVNQTLALSLAIVESQLLHTYKSGKVRVSSKGAVGLFQVKPSVMSNYNLTNIYENADASMILVSWLIKKYKGDKWKAMEAYNCGPSGRLGKYKDAAKRFRKKVSITYVHIKRSGRLWNVYTGTYMPPITPEMAVDGSFALIHTF